MRRKKVINLIPVSEGMNPVRTDHATTCIECGRECPAGSFFFLPVLASEGCGFMPIMCEDCGRRDAEGTL